MCIILNKHKKLVNFVLFTNFVVLYLYYASVWKCLNLDRINPAFVPRSSWTNTFYRPFPYWLGANCTWRNENSALQEHYREAQKSTLTYGKIKLSLHIKLLLQNHLSENHQRVNFVSTIHEKNPTFLLTLNLNQITNTQCESSAWHSTTPDTHTLQGLVSEPLQRVIWWWDGLHQIDEKQGHVELMFVSL